MFKEERIGEIIQQLDTMRYQSKAWEGWFHVQSTTLITMDNVSLVHDWKEFSANEMWGVEFDYAAFKTEVVIPAEYDGEAVELLITTGKEGEWDATNPQFAFYLDGVLKQGLDVNHCSVLMTEKAEAGSIYQILISAYNGSPGNSVRFHTMLRKIDRKIENLYYDLFVPWNIAKLLNKDSDTYIFLVEKLNTAINKLDMRDADSQPFRKSVSEAETYLQESFYSQNKENIPTVYCVGHTHIDIAWLWTIEVTKRKAVRSFSTVLELMNRYPEYKFMSSQPQLYMYVKKYAPDIYKKIKEKIKDGCWEPEGGMFVEADCNLASGESLVRQIIYGKKFFKEEFNKDNHILWLPDVFGYCAALPQIMKKCGLDYFVTTKISWNEVDKMPYDTFWWKGIDGTKVLTHFCPTRDYVSATRKIVTNAEHHSSFTTNYNGYINPSQIKGAWQRYQQKDLNKEVLCSFGYGDGGGGPTAEMLEIQRRLSYGIPGCPKTKISTVTDFFQQMEDEIVDKSVPVWTGELYLEYHRGTYTSMARNKKQNRKSEFALLNLETASVLSELILAGTYPQVLLNDNWKILMRNQFHDILPGSSIKEVYETSDEEYQHLLTSTDACVQDKLSEIAVQAGGILVFNMNGQEMSGFVTCEENAGIESAQKTYDGKYLIWVQQVPAKGFKRISSDPIENSNVQISRNEILTPFARIQFNEKGQISSWYDFKGQRELLQTGKAANVLMTYEDKPHNYDNWNIYEYYNEKKWPVEDLVEAKIIESGPYRYGIQFVWKYLHTTIKQIIFVYSNSPQVDFYLETDWKEDQILLKALFPFELNTSEATYEIQYGNVKRFTGKNTSWDNSRFEVCYHKWMDVAEGDFGVSIMNDCKYGVSVDENTVGLSLIKSGRYPNPDADREMHQMTYSILPHVHGWQDAKTVKNAYLLNNPMIVFNSNLPALEGIDYFCPMKIENRNIMIESIKKADRKSAIIYRIYEFENKTTVASVTLSETASHVWICNMMEQKEEEIAGDTNMFELLVHPYEIITLMVEI